MVVGGGTRSGGGGWWWLVEEAVKATGLGVKIGGGEGCVQACRMHLLFDDGVANKVYELHK